MVQQNIKIEFNTTPIWGIIKIVLKCTKSIFFLKLFKRVTIAKIYANSKLVKNVKLSDFILN